jgi:hypothetical protein
MISVICSATGLRWVSISLYTWWKRLNMSHLYSLKMCSRLARTGNWLPRYQILAAYHTSGTCLRCISEGGEGYTVTISWLWNWKDGFPSLAPSSFKTVTESGSDLQSSFQTGMKNFIQELHNNHPLDASTIKAVSYWLLSLSMQAIDFELDHNFLFCMSYSDLHDPQNSQCSQIPGWNATSFWLTIWDNRAIDTRQLLQKMLECTIHMNTDACPKVNSSEHRLQALSRWCEE